MGGRHSASFAYLANGWSESELGIMMDDFTPFVAVAGACPQRHDVEPRATARRKMSRVSQVIPVIHVEGENAHPRTVFVRLAPDAFVIQVSFVAADAIQIVPRTVRLDGLNEERNSGTPNRLEQYRLLTCRARGKGVIRSRECPPATPGTEHSMESGEPSPDSGLNIEIDNRTL